MRTITVENGQLPDSGQRPSRLKPLAAAASIWLSEQLGTTTRPRPTRVRLAVACAAIFLLSVGVRVLHWQDSHVEIVAGKNALSGVFGRYQKEARRMLDDGGILYPHEPPAAGDARILSHPPGYSMLLAAIDRVRDDPAKWLWIAQIACDAAAALLIFAIALELTTWCVALIAGLLVALSPHLAYYSLLLTPDSLVVLPILLAVYLVIRERERPRVIMIMLAGALIGISCWLQANTLMLGLFLAIAAATLFKRGKRLSLATVLIGSTMLVIAPITVRNLVVFHRFIPLSIQAGLSLVEGIGDYDKDGTLGMPRSDREAKSKDAEWNGRPDYEASLWSPDGIDRDRTRLNRGLAFIRANPRWFLGVMLRRAAFMLTYNESRARQWPFNTASVSPLSAEALYGHPLALGEDATALQSEPPTAVLVLNNVTVPHALGVGNDAEPANSIRATELNSSGVVLSQLAKVSFGPGGQAVEIIGDDSQYGDQLASAPIAVRKNTDYVIELPVVLMRGNMAFKVTSVDRRIAVVACDIAEAVGEAKTTGRMTAIQMPFASGNRTDVRLVVSNNGEASVRPIAQVGRADLFEVGPTPYPETRFPRAVIRTLQRNLFATGRMLPLIILGIALLAIARRGRELAILLAVPLYYLCTQSALHTEYRYILSMHYFVFVAAAVTLYCIATGIAQASKWAASRFSLSARESRFGL